MGESDVQSEGAASIQQHARGECLEGPSVRDQPRSGIPTDECGARGDSGGGQLNLGFRDTRRTCLVIASGPSSREVLGSTRDWADWPAITVNDSWRLHLTATAVYAADRAWWSQRDTTGLRYVDLVRQCFRGQPWTCDQSAAREHGIHLVQIERKEGLSRKEGLIRTGGEVGNSGAQAINLATLAGARRLILIGFDMCTRDGQVHWFGDHPKELNNNSSYSRFVAGMGPMAADLHRDGIEVINTCKWSALPYWPKRSLEDALR